MLVMSQEVHLRQTDHDFQQFKRLLKLLRSRCIVVNC